MKHLMKVSLMAFVAMFAFNTTADAQLGGLLKKAKAAVSGKSDADKGKEVQKQLQADYQAKQNVKQNAKDVSGKPLVFRIKGKELGVYNAGANELTFKPNVAETAQVTYKIDPNTGAITGADGTSKGSLGADGTIVTPNKRTLTFKQDNSKSCSVLENGQVIGTIALSAQAVWSKSRSNAILVDFKSAVDPKVVAYITFGVLFEKKYTTDELDDMVEWTDKESIADITKYEESLPYAGFKATNPEMKNCKVAAVGLLKNAWTEYPYEEDGFYKKYYWLDYWVVYELTNGRNVVALSRAIKNSKYGDVVRKEVSGVERIHEVTDWKRK